MIKKIFAVVLSLSIVVTLSACKAQLETPNDESKSTENIITTYTPTDVSFPNESRTGNETLTAKTTIMLKENTAEISGSGATVIGSVVTITSSGSFLLEGTITNGQLIVDTSDEEKVELYLNGVNITNQSGPAVYVKNATKKVVFYLAQSSVNLITDSSSYTEIDEENPDGAIYSKEDLSFEGSGSLYVTALYADGIVSKDSIEIKSGAVCVNSLDDGIRGKDDVTVTDGIINIVSGGDGIKSTNEEDTDRGNVVISAGTFYIDAALDGIQAINNLEICGGEINIRTGSGSENSSQNYGNEGSDWGNWGGFGGGGRPGGIRVSEQTDTQSSDSGSAKGLKSSNKITLKGGNVTIDSSDDAIHSNNSVEISGGTFGISSGDDGVHADETLTVSGGVIKIDKSYEGLESLNVSILSGTIDLTASDDGINAAGGNDGSSVSGRPGQNMFRSGNGSIIISGGLTTVNASGDGIDANGYIEMNGGTVYVFGPTNSGNGSLDYDKSFTITDGALLAVGSSGMAQSVQSDTQGVITANINNMSEGTVIKITDGNNEIFTFTAKKQFSHLIYSSEKINSNTAYTVYADDYKLGTIKAQ